MKKEEEFPGRFAVFVAEGYYPIGGFGDLHAKVPTVEQAGAIACKEESKYVDVTVVDLIAEARKELK